MVSPTPLTKTEAPPDRHKQKMLLPLKNNFKTKKTIPKTYPIHPYLVPPPVCLAVHTYLYKLPLSAFLLYTSLVR